MKKQMSLILAAVLLLGLLQGCAAEKPKQTTAPDTTAAPETTAVPETTVPETTAAPTEAPEAHLRFSELEMTKEGETFRLYNGTAKIADVTFGSDNEAVVTFSKGIAVCRGEGSATVWAEYNGQRLECAVTCVFPTEPPTEAPTEPAAETTGSTEAPEVTESTEATEAPSYGGGSDPIMAPPSSANVDSSFFDDACFIGDSVSVMLSWHAGDTGCLGNAKFLTKESYSAVNASYNYMTMEYNGVSYDYIEDAVAATGANKCFIMLGTNDIGFMTIGDTIANWRDILNRIQTKCPGIRIYIQSATPIYTEGQVGSLNNEKMDQLNERLMGLAGEYGIQFLNIAPYLKDGTNGLAECYCSDSYVHLTYSGADVWVKALKYLITG